MDSPSLCEILTGKPPYVGRSSEEVRRKACNGDLADVAARLDAFGAEPEVVALTKASLSPEAIDRLRDAQAVADGLSVLPERRASTGSCRTIRSSRGSTRNNSATGAARRRSRRRDSASDGG